MQITNDKELLNHINENIVLIEEFNFSSFVRDAKDFGKLLAGLIFSVGLFTLPSKFYDQLGSGLSEAAEVLPKGAVVLVDNYKFMFGPNATITQKSISWLHDFFNNSGIADSPFGDTFVSIMKTIQDNFVVSFEQTVLVATAVSLILVVIAMYLVYLLFRSEKKPEAIKLLRSSSVVIRDIKKKAKK